jgi:hypothetical protein
MSKRHASERVRYYEIQVALITSTNIVVANKIIYIIFFISSFNPSKCQSINFVLHYWTVQIQLHSQTLWLLLYFFFQTRRKSTACELTCEWKKTSQVQDYRPEKFWSRCCMPKSLRICGTSILNMFMVMWRQAMLF